MGDNGKLDQVRAECEAAFEVPYQYLGDYEKGRWAQAKRILAALDPPVMEPVQVINYLDMNAIGAWFSVPGATVAKWRGRYAASHPCPEPDAMTGRTPGWLPARKAEWLEWKKALPGQTSGLRRGRNERTAG